MESILANYRRSLARTNIELEKERQKLTKLHDLVAASEQHINSLQLFAAQFEKAIQDLSVSVPVEVPNKQRLYGGVPLAYDILRELKVPVSARELADLTLKAFKSEPATDNEITSMTNNLFVALKRAVKNGQVVCDSGHPRRYSVTGE